MPLFQATVAKNNQKVTLSLEQGSKELAREYLHSQGYSILSLEEKMWDVGDTQKTKSFFFVVRIGGQEKKWQIHSSDILRAYKKLTEDLSYEVQSIYEDALSTEEEIAYSTARAKEAYLELRERSTEPAVILKKEDGLKEGAVGGITILEKEVLKYQLLLEKIYNKLTELVVEHSAVFWGDRSARITMLASAIKQARQITNISKLKIIGEEALLKIGALELEITGAEHEENKKKFIAETNALLRGIGSKSRISPWLSALTWKLQTLKDEIFSTSSIEPVAVETKDKSSFTYFKNLRELSLYEQSLKLLKKEIRSLFIKEIATLSFIKSEKMKKLLLKKKLLEQNISILQSRVSGGRFSYTRIVKGLAYYNDLLLYVVTYLANLAIFLIATSTLLFGLLSGIVPGERFQINSFVFFFCLVALFGIFFRNLSKIYTLFVMFFFYALILLGLGINF
jgi:hypothetical protein